MEAGLIRSKFLDYFASNYHEVLPGSSLVPQDPTLLFVNAGMVQFKSRFQGGGAKFKSAVTVQPCVRAGGKHNDLSQVGKTTRHHTFFEMLGNFSFGEYFKTRAIELAWNFLTIELKLDPNKLLVTVFEEDEESLLIWHQHIGLPKARIIKCGAEDNFWSMGDTGPCGPCTEIFYDHGPGVAGGLPGTIDADGDRYVEIWNLVFMQYDMRADGTRVKLPRPCVDTGMGLERIAAVLQGVSDNYNIDIFVKIIAAIKAEIAPKKLSVTGYRVIADHLRTAVFLIADEVYPSNEGRGYVLRRIIRRAIRYAYQAGIDQVFLPNLVDVCIQLMNAKQSYPHVWGARLKIIEVLTQESIKFNNTIKQGMRVLLAEIKDNANKVISGKVAFKLHDTHGFPLDLTEDVARESGFVVNVDEFYDYMEQQKLQARSAHSFKADDMVLDTKQAATEFVGRSSLVTSAQIVEIFVDQKLTQIASAEVQAIVILDKTSFYAEKGGQVGDVGTIVTDSAMFKVTDTQEYLGVVLHYGTVIKGQLQIKDTVTAQVASCRLEIMANHTATHLLHAALRQILGDTVVQQGSLVSAEKLRFDFRYDKPLSKQELYAVQALVNQWVLADLSCKVEEMTIEKARQSGALALFDEKYDATVRVVSYGDCSKELCGGTHLNSTALIGSFKLFADSSIASGVRRIEAITRHKAYEHLVSNAQVIDKLNDCLNCNVMGLVDKVEQLQQSKLSLVNKLAAKELQDQQLVIKQILAKHSSNKPAVFVECFQAFNMQQLRDFADQLQVKLPSYIFILIGVSDKLSFVSAVSKDLQQLFDAKQVLNHLIENFNCSGGGKPGFIQGVAKDNSILDSKDELIAWLNSVL